MDMYPHKAFCYFTFNVTPQNSIEQDSFSDANRYAEIKKIHRLQPKSQISYLICNSLH
jgi:hypothetical protein